MHIPNKPFKFWIKFLMLSDSNTFYTIFIEPCVGNDEHDVQIPLARCFMKGPENRFADEVAI
jgi:hypothetical protein